MIEQRLLRLLPIGLLCLSTAVALVARPELGDAVAGAPVTLAVAGAAGAWIAVFPAAGPVSWSGRTALAFALCWLNPLFGIFAFVGFLDVFDALPGRWHYVGLAAVGVTQAGAQSGGFPPDGTAQAVVFGPLVLLNSGLAALFGTLAERTERRNAELERLNDHLGAALADNDMLHDKLFDQARRAGALEERQRLAREIHDTIAQSLAGIVTQLEVAVRGDRQDRALHLARAALADARRSMHDLAPSDLENATLSEALNAVVGAVSGESTIRAEVVVVGDARPLHPEVEATVLRVAQECLANVAKHARATRVGVTLSYDGDEVVLDVRDDGVGFEPSVPTAEGSFGLRSIKQRIARLSGELTLESRPGDGTAVSVRIPALTREAA